MIDLNSCGSVVIDLKACRERFCCVCVDFNVCGNTVNVCGCVVI